MKIGYVRVSTEGQNTARQEVLMEQLGVEKLFTDKASGKDTSRPGLQDMLSFIREGDVLVVESISRLARSTRDLLTITEEITAKGAEFVSQKENIDTTTPTGKFMLTVFAALAELERDNILQRQREGIELAKAAGKYRGRVPIAVDEDRFKAEVTRWRDGEMTARACMEKLGLKPNSFYRKVKERGL